MVMYFTDKEKKNLDPGWVDEFAQKAVHSFFPDPNPRNSPIKNSQLRKFYADVKTLERQWQARGGDNSAFVSILPMIKLLKAKSDYAKYRKVIPESFKEWLWKHIDSVNDERDFSAFLLHFEAVVGFSAQFTKE